MHGCKNVGGWLAVGGREGRVKISEENYYVIYGWPVKLICIRNWMTLNKSVDFFGQDRIQFR
jgi:hypothetical protein